MRRWFGHVERSSSVIRTAFHIHIDGKRGAGRPKLTWKKLIEKTAVGDAPAPAR